MCIRVLFGSNLDQSTGYNDKFCTVFRIPSRQIPENLD
jgi:hypothetical protein